MARRPLSPIFNTHLANFHCFSKLAAMTHTLAWNQRIVTCCQRCDRGNKALTMSSRPPLGTTGRIYRKSPPRTMIFPPKIFSVAYASSNCIKSCRVQSTASKARWCIISASSQMIRSTLRTNSATSIYCVMLQVDSLCKSSGILNLEWPIMPPRSNKNAIPNEATASTILLCPRRRDRIVVQTNVLLVPPLEYTKNNLPSLFVTTQNNFICVALIIIGPIFCIIYIFGQWMLIISQPFLDQSVSSMNRKDIIRLGKCWKIFQAMFVADVNLIDLI